MTRRETLTALSGAVASAALLSATGCEVAWVRGSAGECRDEPDFSLEEGVSFSIFDEDFLELQEVGGMAPLEECGARVILIRDAEDSVLAFSLYCSHASQSLGDSQSGGIWLPEQRQLVCGLHGATFDEKGDVVTWPDASPESSLPRYRVEFDPGRGEGLVFPLDRQG